VAIHRILRSSRLNVDDYFLQLAKIVGLRSTCARRAVGCVLVDQNNHVMATGYNGVHSGAIHCLDRPCSAATSKSGEGLEECKAIHAEVNALVQCADVQSIYAVYCTASPCVHCMRLILNTSAERVVFHERYPHEESFELARMHGVSMYHLGPKSES
jgi:dCMP deaminase